jgi:hypothetical protein
MDKESQSLFDEQEMLIAEVGQAKGSIEPALLAGAAVSLMNIMEAYYLTARASRS